MAATNYPKIQMPTLESRTILSIPIKKNFSVIIFPVSVEPNLKLELPVAACNIAGNADEGSKRITNAEQADFNGTLLFGDPFDVLSKQYFCLIFYQF